MFQRSVSSRRRASILVLPQDIQPRGPVVRLKGKPPTDVLVGEGRSGREVQVLYNEPGAKELYFFVNNRLDRIVK